MYPLCELGRLQRALSVLLMVWATASLQPAHAHACTEIALPDSPLEREWTFRAASPLSAAPAVTASGQAYVVTHEGYLHALSASGGFLWSYTVDGALLSGPQADEQGRVYVVSTAGFVYGIQANGNPHWVFQSPVLPRTPLSYSPRKLVYFASGSFLYAISSGRGVLWRALLPGPVLAGPVSDPEGRAWVITDGGMLHVIGKPWARTQGLLPGADEYQILETGEGGGLILAGLELVQVDAAGKPRWSFRGVRQAAAIGQGAVAVTDDQPERLLWLEEGEPVRAVSLAGLASASPRVVGRRVFVPGADGQLHVVSNGAVASCQVAHAPLFTPVHVAGRLWVAAGDGVLTTFSLRSQPAPRRSR